MKLAATITRSFQANIQAEFRDIEHAVATGTTRDAGRRLRTELRRQVTPAALGQRLANSWRDKHFPNQKLDAASLVYTKAPQIIRAFDEGAVIRSRRGRFLAIRPRTHRGRAPTASGSARAPSRSTDLDHSGWCLGGALVGAAAGADRPAAELGGWGGRGGLGAIAS
jgi:Family of unknown function (DUF6441)